MLAVTDAAPAVAVVVVGASVVVVGGTQHETEYAYHTDKHLY